MGQVAFIGLDGTTEPGLVMLAAPAGDRELPYVRDTNTFTL